MALDWGQVAEKAIAPVVTGVGGFIGAALNFKRRLEDIEKDFTKYKDAVKEEFENLKKAWRLEMDSLKEELQGKLKELDTELKELDDSFTRFQRASNADFADAEEMRHFIEGQQRQWQQIQRTLGQIEGLMERVGNLPPAPPPRTMLPPTRR